MSVPPTHIVGIGASLGGLAVVETMLKALPRDYPHPFVMVQHRADDSNTRLLDLLQRHCALPIKEPDDKEPLEGGAVYLAPAGYHMLVNATFVSLSLDAPRKFARPSIDVLFQSMADTFGPCATVALLTGSNDDGAEGAAAVKRAGGRVYVQDPNDAEAPTGPRAVLALTRVDGILPAPALAHVLATLAPAPPAAGRGRRPGPA